MPWGNSREEMFGSVSRLMHFGVYFEITLNRNDYFHVEIHISYSCTYILGGSGVYASSLRKCGTVWCSLVRAFGVYYDQIVS